MNIQTLKRLAPLLMLALLTQTVLLLVILAHTIFDVAITGPWYRSVPAADRDFSGGCALHCAADRPAHTRTQAQQIKSDQAAYAYQRGAAVYTLREEDTNVSTLL